MTNEVLSTLTIDEVSKLTKLDRRVIKKEIDQGTLYAKLIGRIYRIPLAAYYAWLHGRPYEANGRL